MRFLAQAAVDDEYLQRTYDLSVRDGLTRLHNRRFFDERLRAEVACARRHRSLLSLLMIDVDHFKRVNDRLGHVAGDEVLRGVAAAMAARIRAEDVLARYGGEEFALLARGIPDPGARTLAERLRMGVAGLEVRRAEIPVTVTVSIGVATAQGSPELQEDALLEAADRLLYAAKEGGRNRTSAGEFGVAADPAVPR